MVIHKKFPFWIGFQIFPPHSGDFSPSTVPSTHVTRFKARLLTDANSACASIGVNAVNPTAPTQLLVFEQTPKVREPSGREVMWVKHGKTMP